jgi:hypothetical protein
MKEEDGRAMRKVYCYLRFIDVRTDNAHIRVGEVRTRFPLSMLMSLSVCYDIATHWGKQAKKFQGQKCFSEDIECRSQFNQAFCSGLKNSVNGYPHPLLVLLLVVEGLMPSLPNPQFESSF